MLNISNLLFSWTVRRCYFSGCFFLENLPSLIKPTFSRSTRKYASKLCSIVIAQQNCYSMSSSVEDDNVRLLRKRKYSTSANASGTVVKRTKIPSHLEIIPGIDALTPIEKKTLEKWKSILSQTKHYYEAIFVLGPMCSGKTSTITDFKTSKVYSQFAYIDTDEIMEGLDGYDNTGIDVFYPSARKVSICLTDWLLEERLSFIAEGTCVKYRELEDYMIRLKKKGYDIKVKKIDNVSLETVLGRTEQRVNRHVSSEVIKDIYVNSNIGLKMLWKINKYRLLFEEFL